MFHFLKNAEPKESLVSPICHVCVCVWRATQAGEELTFDYGLLNDAVLAYYGQPTPDCRGLKR